MYEMLPRPTAQNQKQTLTKASQIEEHIENVWNDAAAKGPKSKIIINKSFKLNKNIGHLWNNAASKNPKSKITLTKTSSIE